MDNEIFKMSPNPERAKNILQQVEIREEALATLDKERYQTLIIEGYYEVIKELLTAVLALDGYKTLSHTALIEYLKKQYQDSLSEFEIHALDELRKVRNRISYEGFIIKKEYYERRAPVAVALIKKLKGVVKEKIILK